MPKHIITKLQKTKDKAKILKLVREKWCFTQGRRVWMTAGIWTEFLEARGHGTTFSLSAEIKESQLRILHLTKLPFRKLKRGKHTLRQREAKGIEGRKSCFARKEFLNRKSGKVLDQQEGRERRTEKSKNLISVFWSPWASEWEWLLWNCHAESRMKTERWRRGNSSAASKLVIPTFCYHGAIILDSLNLISWSLKRRSRGQRCSWRLWEALVNCCPQEPRTQSYHC